MTDQYGIHTYETRHTRRVRVYRFVADFLAFALLMGLVMLIAVMG